MARPAHRDLERQHHLQPPPVRVQRFERRADQSDQDQIGGVTGRVSGPRRLAHARRHGHQSADASGVRAVQQTRRGQDLGRGDSDRRLDHVVVSLRCTERADSDGVGLG
jgi:hypothetical protein